MMAFAPSNFMLIPAAGCQAACSYCFGPSRGPLMALETLAQTLDFIDAAAPANTKLRFTFHGGEPLLAGHAWFRTALPMLRERFGLLAKLSLQSNLWALDDAYVALFRQYKVSISTSLDAFPAMCDAQRGAGYFAQTWAGIRRLRAHGLEPHCICTVTPPFARRGPEIFRFFQDQDLPFTLHAALPALNQPLCGCELPPRDAAAFYLQRLETYGSSLSHGSIGIFNAMAKGCFERQGCLCSFCDCLGAFAAIDPQGNVYSCQRFAGMPAYALGHVTDGPATLTESAAYHQLADLRRAMQTACADCRHQTYCGGCMYNALAAGQSNDPYCETYRAVFDRLTREMALEMGQLLLDEIQPAQTKVLAMAGDRPHPYLAKRRERRRQTALQWGQSQAPAYLTEPLRNKVYLHVTFNCPLNCAHCYATVGADSMSEMPVALICRTVREARQELFSAVVITGGEPLWHVDVDAMLAQLAALPLQGMHLILRSSLGFDLPVARLQAAARVFSEIVVSVDGDAAAHDARRGVGSYAKTVANLERICDEGPAAKLSLCATLTAQQRQQGAMDAVTALGKRLGITSFKVKPVLPLGRAANMTFDQDCSCVNICAADGILGARAGCGLGQNLYIEPDGNVYPCYAWCGPDKLLGRLDEGLPAIMASSAMQNLARYTVDDNPKCRHCVVRYLCGGMCKAFVKDKHHLHSGAFDCGERKRALEHLAQV